MKTNLNNIWQKCSWRHLQQNYVQQLSDLFVEFQDESQFFHITTMEHWNIAIQKAFVVAIGIFQVLLLKLVNIWLSYSENERVNFFWNTV